VDNHKCLQDIQNSLASALSADLDYLIIEVSALKKKRFDKLMSWLTTQATAEASQ
jgi:hypothetical protein